VSTCSGCALITFHRKSQILSRISAIIAWDVIDSGPGVINPNGRLLRGKELEQGRNYDEPGKTDTKYLRRGADILVGGYNFYPSGDRKSCTARYGEQLPGPEFPELVTEIELVHGIVGGGRIVCWGSLGGCCGVGLKKVIDPKPFTRSGSSGKWTVSSYDVSFSTAEGEYNHEPGEPIVFVAQVGSGDSVSWLRQPGTMVFARPDCGWYGTPLFAGDSRSTKYAFIL